MMLNAVLVLCTLFLVGAGVRTIWTGVVWSKGREIRRSDDPLQFYVIAGVYLFLSACLLFVVGDRLQK